MTARAPAGASAAVSSIQSRSRGRSPGPTSVYLVFSTPACKARTDARTHVKLASGPRHARASCHTGSCTAAHGELSEAPRGRPRTVPRALRPGAAQRVRPRQRHDILVVQAHAVEHCAQGRAGTGAGMEEEGRIRRVAWERACVRSGKRRPGHRAWRAGRAHGAWRWRTADGAPQPLTVAEVLRRRHGAVGKGVRRRCEGATPARYTQISACLVAPSAACGLAAARKGLHGSRPSGAHCSADSTSLRP